MPGAGDGAAAAAGQREDAVVNRWNLGEEFIDAAEANRVDDLKEIIALVGKHVSINDEIFERAMFRSVIGGAPDSVEYLLEQGVVPRSEYLARAAERRYLRIVEVLVESGIDPKENESQALSCAAVRGAFEVCNYLYDLSDVDAAVGHLSLRSATNRCIETIINRRQAEIEAEQLSTLTKEAAGAWSPDPKEADVQFERRYAEACHGQGMEPQRHQAAARMRL